MIITLALNSGANHHCCTKGRKVIVKLWNGETIIDKFKEKNKRYCVLDNHEFSWSEVKVFAIYKRPITREN